MRFGKEILYINVGEASEDSRGDVPSLVRGYSAVSDTGIRGALTDCALTHGIAEKP